MVLTHLSKDPLNKTSDPDKIDIFPQLPILRWKQDQGLFKLNGKPSKYRNPELNNYIKIVISIKYG